MPDAGNLYIRWSETGSDDNRTDPGGARAYLSKSLKIMNPADPVQDDGLALTGIPQQIRVDVDTLVTTTNVGVQVWACAWGTAGQPFLPSTNGAAGLLRDLDDALNPFTAQPGPAAQLTVDFDWTPLKEDLVSIGAATDADLHVCLLANCYSTAGNGDGALIPPPGPPTIDLASNRHHAQRNIRVHPVANGFRHIRISLFSGNPFPEGEDLFVLQVGEAERPQLDREDRMRLQQGRWLRDDRELPGRGGKLHGARRPIEEIAMAIAGESGRGCPVEVPLTAGRPEVLELDVEVPEDEPGALHALDIVHRHAKTVVGGARVLLVTVDEERLAGLTPREAAAL